MDTPSTALGWLAAAGLVWQLVAYAGAALAGLRLFGALKSEAAPRPGCVIAATTRCMLGLAPSGLRVEASDMLRLGALGLAIAALAIAGNTALHLLVLDWGEISTRKFLLWVGGHIALGSALMIALTGAHRYIMEGDDAA